MMKKIKEGLYLVRQQSQPPYKDETDFVISVQPAYHGKYKVQVRYEPAEGFMGENKTFKEKAQTVKEGYIPSSGNALPVHFNLSDAKKVALAIANSKLFMS